MTDTPHIKKSLLWIRGLAIILPLLIPGSYLLQSVQLVVIAQIITWLCYTLLIYWLPIRRATWYCFIVMLVVTFIYSLVGTYRTMALHQQTPWQHVPDILFSAILLTVGTLLFTTIAWLCFWLIDKILLGLIARLDKAS